MSRQIEREQQAVTGGQDRYMASVKRSKELGSLNSLAPEVRLMFDMISPAAERILQYTRKTFSGKNTQPVSQKFLKTFDPTNAAFIAIRRMMTMLGRSESVTFQEAALAIVEDLIFDHNYRKFKEAFPGLVYTIELDSENDPKIMIYQKFEREYRKHLPDRLALQKAQRLQAGKEVIAQVVGRFVGRAANGSVKAETHADSCFELFSDRTIDCSDKEPMTRIRYREDVDVSLKDAHAQASLFSPLLRPLVEPPKPWTNPCDGGFHTLRQQMVRGGKSVQNAAWASKMPAYYKGLNALQATTRRINRQVLEVLEVLAERGGVAGLCLTSKEQLVPPKPWVDTHEGFLAYREKHGREAIRAWKSAKNAGLTQFAIERGKRRVVAQQIAIAQELRDEPTIWFAWFADSRSRLYPLADFLHPQANDTGKALLTFAKGKPLGDRGAYWLAVHGANTFGNDKVSFDDRVAWVESEQLNVRLSAENPLDYLWWTEADKPFQFLAFCFEWDAYQKSGLGQEFVSTLPCAVDGSCNGLQHFSMLFRDEVGGKATNLIPQDLPSDIYRDVAAYTSQYVAAHAQGNMIGMACADDEQRAKFIEIAKVLDGQITRVLTKRNTMTLPYGATLNGFRGQLLKELPEYVEKGKVDLKQFNTRAGRRDVALYLARVNDKAIRHVVIKGMEGREYLQKTARILAKESDTITWTTPTGFQVVQQYRKQESKVIDTYFGKARLRMRLSEDLPESNASKHASALAPNFIHSLDASHMITVINRCADNGITEFSMVHDSYAVPAGDSQFLFSAIRDAFVDLYVGSDPLEDFYVAQSERFNVRLDPPPAKGTLDPEGVRKSLYFFS